MDEHVQSLKIIEACRSYGVYILVIMINLRYVLSGISESSTFFFTLLINAILFLSINYARVQKKALVLFVVLGLLVVKNFASIAVLDFFLFAYIIKKNQVCKVLYLNLLIMLFSLLIVFYFVEIGVIENQYTYLPKVDAYSNNIGFKNPNVLSLYLYSIIVSLYMCVCGRISVILKLLLLIISWLIYSVIYSRTAFYGVVVLLVVDIIVHSKMRFLVSRFVLNAFPILLVLLTCYFLINYTEYPILNTLLSGRLSIMGGYFVTINPIDWLLGFPWDAELQLDSAYASMISLGGFVSIVLCYIYYSKYIKRFDSKTLPIVISFLSIGLTEYVFVGLNMASVILICIIVHGLNNKENISSSTCL